MAVRVKPVSSTNTAIAKTAPVRELQACAPNSYAPNISPATITIPTRVRMAWRTFWRRTSGGNSRTCLRVSPNILHSSLSRKRVSAIPQIEVNPTRMVAIHTVQLYRVERLHAARRAVGHGVQAHAFGRK